MPSTLKQEAQQLLSNVPGEYVFRCHNGSIIASISKLGDSPRNISDEDYIYHVNENKNDFSNWVSAIIKDNRLASNLSKVTNKNQEAKIVAARLASLRKRAR